MTEYQWKDVSVVGFDELMQALDRADRKGYMPDAIKDEWEAFNWKPAQQQEPVAQEWRYYFSHSGATGKPDEVVGPCFTDRKEVAFGVGCFDQTALCPPASKPWVGLTDEEIHDIYDAVAKQEPYAMAVTRRNIAHAIEAKLREKNAQPSNPLTDEQRQYVVQMWRDGNWTAGDIIDAVEAAHGIKGDA